MKNPIRVLSTIFPIFCLAIVQIACEGSSNIIQNDDNATQTLIISRSARTDLSSAPNSLTSDLNWLSYLVPVASVDDGIFNNQFTFASMHSMSDVANWVGIDFGSVKLGDVEVIVFDTTKAKFSVEADGELKVVPFHYQTFDSELDVDTFAGPMLFTSTNSPDLSDISHEINFPERNYITNLERNQEIDADNDLIIQLKRALNPTKNSGLLIVTNVERYLDNPFDNKFDGVPHLLVQVAEPTDQIVVPHAELQRLKSEGSGGSFAIGLKVLEKIDEIELRSESSGELLQTLDIGVSSSHWIRFRFAR